MKKEQKTDNKDLIIKILKTSVLGIIITGIFMAIFSAAMYFFELDNSLSPLLATLSVSIGSLAASFYAAKTKGSQGYLTGFIVGVITFILITLISFILDDGGITSNTVFHLIIIILSSLIGGILGVNKKEKKYI